jgi:Flp pilus assembly protein protease CpaA
MIDNILLFVAGMILGGFVIVKVEAVYFAKKFPNANLSDLEYREVMNRLSFVESFIAVFIAVVVYFTIKNYFLYGVCLGAFIFSRK